MKILVVKSAVAACSFTVKMESQFLQLHLSDKMQIVCKRKKTTTTTNPVCLFLRQGLLLCSPGWPRTLSNRASVSQVLVGHSHAWIDWSGLEVASHLSLAKGAEAAQAVAGYRSLFVILSCYECTLSIALLFPNSIILCQKLTLSHYNLIVASTVVAKEYIYAY